MFDPTTAAAVHALCTIECDEKCRKNKKISAGSKRVTAVPVDYIDSVMHTAVQQYMNQVLNTIDYIPS